MSKFGNNEEVKNKNRFDGDIESGLGEIELKELGWKKLKSQNQDYEEKKGGENAKEINSATFKEKVIFKLTDKDPVTTVGRLGQGEGELGQGEADNLDKLPVAAGLFILLMIFGTIGLTESFNGVSTLFVATFSSSVSAAILWGSYKVSSTRGKEYIKNLIKAPFRALAPYVGRLFSLLDGAAVVTLEGSLSLIESAASPEEKNIFKKPSLVYGFLNHHFGDKSFGQASLLKDCVPEMLHSNLTTTGLSDLNNYIFSTTRPLEYFAQNEDRKLIDEFEESFCKACPWNLGPLGNVPDLKTVQFLVLSAFAQALLLDETLLSDVNRREFMEAYVDFRNRFRDQLSPDERRVFDARIAPFLNSVIQDPNQIPGYAELRGFGEDKLQKIANLPAEGFFPEGYGKKEKEEVKHEAGELEKKENVLKNASADTLSNQEKIQR